LVSQDNKVSKACEILFYKCKCLWKRDS